MAFHASVLTALPPTELEELIPQIRDGDLLLCSTRSKAAHLIRWSTQSPWSHIAMVYRLPVLGRLCVFECVQGRGVRMVSLERFISQGSNGKRPFPGKIILARHAQMTTKSNLKPMIDFAIDTLGDPFSPMEIVKIGIRIVFGRFNMHLPKSYAKDDKFICSEYIAEALKKVGITINWDGRGFIAPDDFALDPEVSTVAQVRTD